MIPEHHYFFRPQQRREGLSYRYLARLVNYHHIENFLTERHVLGELSDPGNNTGKSLLKIFKRILGKLLLSFNDATKSFSGCSALVYELDEPAVDFVRHSRGVKLL